MKNEITRKEGKIKTIIMAMSSNGVIGKAGKIPWFMPADLAHYKKSTIGKVIVVGRKTYESLPAAALQGRIHVVLSRNYSPRRSADFVIDNLEDALSLADNISEGSEVIIAGGSEVYKQALPLADRAIITYVTTKVEGDTYMATDTFNTRDWMLQKEDQLYCQDSKLHSTICHYASKVR